MIDETRMRIALLREELNDIKREHGCAICRETDYRCLVFHHIDASRKRFNVNANACYSRSQDEIREEVENCAVLCCNCHAKVHYAEPVPIKPQSEKLLRKPYRRSALKQRSEVDTGALRQQQEDERNKSDARVRDVQVAYVRRLRAENR